MSERMRCTRNTCCSARGDCPRGHTDAGPLGSTSHNNSDNTNIHTHSACAKLQTHSDRDL